MLDLEKIKQAVGELEEEQVIHMLNAFIDTNPTQQDAEEVVSACQEGMSIVGDLFEKGDPTGSFLYG